MTTLVSIGCSHTAGAMLDGKGTSWHNHQNSFGGLIAKKYDLPHYQMGVPGASNQYIYRSTIKFINSVLNENDDYIFLLGWTSEERIELRYPENTNHIHKVIGDCLDLKYVPFTSGTHPDLYKTQELKDMSKLAPLIFYREQLATDWAVYAYTLQKIFKHKNIKYYMFNTCYELPVNQQNKDIVENLDTNLYYRPVEQDHSMLYWAMKNGYKKTDCWHLYHDGHQAWADHLEMLMKQQGLLTNITSRMTVSSADFIDIDGVKITTDDLSIISKKYRIEARFLIDKKYKKIYVVYPEAETVHSIKNKTEIVNRYLARKFKSTIKVSVYDNEFYNENEDFLINHLRKKILVD